MTGGQVWGAAWWDGRHAGIGVTAALVATTLVGVSWRRRPVLDRRWATIVAALALCQATGVAQHLWAVTAATIVATALAVAPITPSGAGWVGPAGLMVAAVGVYLTVPDTEVAIVVGASLVPVAARAFLDDEPWVTAASAAWIVALLAAVIDGGWGRGEMPAGLAVVSIPLTAAITGPTRVSSGRVGAAFVVAAAVMSLFLARVVSAWDPFAAWLTGSAVALASLGWMIGLRRPSRSVA